jgi:hypothetical protein
MGGWAAEWYERARWPRLLKQGLIAVCAAANVAIFLAFPAYCSYRSVRQFEAELQSTETALPQVGAPDDLLIVSFDSHFLGYRHAGYYLPGYLTLEYPEVKLNQGSRIFAMQGRDTFLLAGLPAARLHPFRALPAAHRRRRVRQLPGKNQEDAARQRPEQRGPGGHHLRHRAHRGFADSVPARRPGAPAGFGQ